MNQTCYAPNLWQPALLELTCAKFVTFAIPPENSRTKIAVAAAAAFLSPYHYKKGAPKSSIASMRFSSSSGLLPTVQIAWKRPCAIIDTNIEARLLQVRACGALMARNGTLPRTGRITDNP